MSEVRPLRAVPLMIALVVAPLLAAGAASAEDPHNRDCTGIVVPLLCAGADAGTNGGCEPLANDRPEVSCWYTYGWNLNAATATPLPGGGRLEWSYDVTYCVSGQECVTVENGSMHKDCVWTLNAAEPCAEQDVSGGTLDFILALGECVTVTATVSVASEAWLGEGTERASEAHVTDRSVGGAAVCYLDNGRD